MFMLPQVIIAFSFLMTIFSFLPRLSAEDIFNPDLGSDFDEDLLTDPFSGDGISNADDLIMASTSPMDNIFDLGRTVDDANPLLGDQETLAAADTGSADISCRAEDNNNPSSLWLTSRLRLRENNNNNFQSELADGKFCVSPAQQGGAAENDENLDLPSFQQLPVVTDIVRPLPEVRQDLCPPWRFGARDIPVCSMANTRFITYQGARMTVVPGAVFYNAFYGCLAPERLWCCRMVAQELPSRGFGEIGGWRMNGYDCLLNQEFGLITPQLR